MMGNRTESHCVEKVMQRQMSPTIDQGFTMPKKTCSYHLGSASATGILGRSVLVLALILGTPAVALAQEAPSFLIERITVTGVALSSNDVIISESHLETGRSYTEHELRQAIYRIERLPFVLAAEFSLRKGAERGSYELVITVTEAARFFASASAVAYRSKYSYNSYGDTHNDEYLTANAGARHFVSPYTEISGGLSSGWTPGENASEPTYEIAATHYNLFDRHVIGSATVRRADEDTTLGLQIIVPTGTTHAIDLLGSYGHRSVPDCDLSVVPFCGGEATYYSGGLSWTLDTTDDPFTPRVGTKLSVHAGYSRGEQEITTTYPTTPESDVSMEGLGADLSAARYVPFGARHSIGVLGSASWARDSHDAWSWFSDDPSDPVIPKRSKADFETFRLGASAVHYFILQSVSGPGNFKRWWLESRAGFEYGRTRNELSVKYPLSSHKEESKGGQASVALVGRSRWGVVTFKLSYTQSHVGR
jgi:hypothetical protein